MTPAGSKLPPHIKRAAWVVGLGGLLVLGPWSLHRWAEGRVQAAVKRQLSRRLGGEVTVGAVRAMGPLGVRVHGVRVRWPGRGKAYLAVSDLRVQLALGEGLGPQIRSLHLRGVDFVWRRAGALSGLRRLARRYSGASSRRAAPRRSRTRSVQMRVQLRRVEVAERAPGPPPYGLRELIAQEVLLTRDSAGRWRSQLRRVAARGLRGGIATLTGISWSGRRRKTGGLRTLRLRVARGEVRVEGVKGAREQFSLWADEVAPDLLEVRLTSPPGRPQPRRDVDARARGVAVYAVADGMKRRLRAKVGGLFALKHFQRLVTRTGVDVRDARLQGRLGVQANPREVALTSDATLTRVRIQRRLLAPVPVRWPRVGLKLKVRYRPAQRQLVLDQGDLTVADVPVHLYGTLTFQRRGLQVQAELNLPPTDCARIFAAVPPELVPKLRGMKLAGKLGARIRVALQSRALSDLKLSFEARPQRCRVLRDPPGADVQALRRPFTFVSRPPGAPARRLVMGPKNPDWRPYTQLGRNVKAAFLAAEDRRFFDHHGFDLENIRRAVAENLRHRHLLKGASSISQQVVKNVFLSHRRDLSRKLQEAVLTWRMEQVLSKRRILEIYLNLVEMGPDLFGVRAAARHYFHREPAHLNPLQAAHLGAVTPSPRRYFHRFKSGRAGMDWLLHLRWLMRQMLRIGWISRGDFNDYRDRDLRLITPRD